MNHVKHNWVENEVFHASDLNALANTVNELIDSEDELVCSQAALSERVDKIINDEEESTNSAFSSEKTLEVINEKIGELINDDEVSDASTFSSSKIMEEIENCGGFKTLVVDKLPEIGEPNTMYFTPASMAEKPVVDSSILLRKNIDGDLVVLANDANTSQREPMVNLAIGDVFRFAKSQEQEGDYAVALEIDKNVITGRINSPFQRDENLIRVTGILRSAILENGHCYKLKDRYAFNGSRLDGYSSFMYAEECVGFELLIFEEVFEPVDITYDNVDFVPSANLLENFTYRECPKLHICAISSDEEDPETHELRTKIITSPESAFSTYLPIGIKCGDVIKVTGENQGLNDHPFICATIVDDETLSYNGEDISGITSTVEWGKNWYFRFTGYHICKTVSEEIPDEYKILVPTFDVLPGEESADYEIESLPFMSESLVGNTNLNDEWMWIEEGWEQIGSSGGSEPTGDYYTKEQTDGLLNNKQDTIYDLEAIRSGATLGYSAIQEFPTVTVDQVLAVLEGNQR